jgi:tetratricopeptide (TPR) repeat protein
MTWVVLLASAVLAGVAAVGVLRPFGGGNRAVALERLADPLDDERRGLFRTLRDLDEERATGQLTDEAYRGLRAETEARAVAVLRALEARDEAGELAAGLRSLRSSGKGNGDGSAERPGADRRRVFLGVLVGTLIVAAVVPVLARAIGNRTGGQPITGDSVGAGPLSFFEQRVAQHPNDVAARLDLAQRYLEAGDARSAVDQYLDVLKLDPRNAEAQANLGFVLFQAGRAQDGLNVVEKALAADPNYPEALYFKGVILLRGLHRPADAAVALRAYLDAAPFGSHRSEVETLLREAQG